jgi:exonuclease III
MPIARLPTPGALQLLLALALLACGPSRIPDRSTGAADAAPISLRVMTFNVEYGGVGVDFSKVIEAIELGAPDIVGLEEPEGNAPAIAAALGWKHVDPRSDVISRFPIIDPPGGDGRFVLVEVRPGEVVAVANVHLPSDPYGPYWVAAGRSVGELLALERRLRLPKIQPILAAFRGLEGMPGFLVGDFNAPSRLDWTPAAVGARRHLRYSVDWPVSAAVEEAGFVDSFRVVHPDPVQTPGLTWWAARPAVGDDFTGDPQDRIDFVYAIGPARVVDSQIVGEAGARDVALGVTPWPSDHRAVLSTFRVTPAPMPRLVAVNAQRLVSAGETLFVQVHNPGGVGRRVALVPSDRVAAGSPARRRASAREVGPGRGSLELATRNLAPGSYEVVLLSVSDDVLSRVSVRVKAPGDATELVVDRAVYAPGETISVQWRNGPGHRWDWIGVFPASLPPGASNSLLWRHTDTRIDGQLAIEGVDAEEQVWPLPPGRYQVLYLLQDALKPVAQAEFEVRELASRQGERR